MRLETISLSGVLRFPDPVTVDFRELPQGLIALVGANGEGKTSLLEAWIAALYRTLPSRGDRSLVDVAHGAQSAIETTFAVDGVGVYRARVALNGVQRTSEAVLAMETSTGPQILTDGKVTTFDAYVAQHFPPLDVVLASSFASQNRSGSFILRKPKERKQLFSSLLGLSHLDDLSHRSGEAAKLIDAERQRLLTEAKTLARDTSREVEAEIARASAEVEERLERATADEREAKSQVERAEARHATLVESARRHEEAKTQLSAIHRQRLHLTGRLDTLKVERQDVERADERESIRIRQDRDDRVRDLDERIANNRALMQDADAIRSAVTARAANEQATADADGARNTLNGTRERLTDEIASLDRQIERDVATRRALEDATRAAAGRDLVPCHGAGDYAVCQFLHDATAAAERVAGLKAKVDAIDPSRPGRLIDLKAQRDTVLLEFGNATQRCEQLRQERSELDRVARRVGPLEAAEARIEELQREREGVTQQASARLADLATATSERTQQLAEQVERVNVELATLRAEQATHEQVEEETRATAMQQADCAQSLEAARRAMQSAATTIARLTAERTAVDGRRRAFEARQTEIAAVDAHRVALDQEWREWHVIGKALGRDGIQTLEIDAAGPTVSSFCNDLLASCFGTRFTLELITQEARKATGKAGGMKEVFSIRIFDNERGGEPRDITDLSGGEQVIVDEALKNALAIYANTRSSMPIRTCWRDETTGALDVENAERYVTMLRKVQEVGGFGHVLFVTHNPDAAAQADAQIVLRDGTVSVRRPPYQSAA